MSDYDLEKSRQLYLLIDARDLTEKSSKLINDPAVNVNLSYGETPLWLAAYDGNTKIVEALLRRPDIDVNQVNSLECSPLYIVAQEGKEDVVKLLLERPDIDVNKVNEDGCTPLWIAA